MRSRESTQTVMLDVLLALTPALVAGVYHFGWRAFALTTVSAAACVIFEWAFQKATKRPVTVSDLSAVVTGVLLAYNMPAAAPFWVPVVGAFVAIIISKQLFGGIGQNFVNPALAARAFLLAAYPAAMTNWSITPDAVSSATPLAVLKTGIAPVDTDYINAFTGAIGGCIGETCAAALLLGGVYLLVRKVITPVIPLTYAATVAVLTWIFGRTGAGAFSGYPVYELLTGGFMLGAFFMATDYSTSPITPLGQVIMGVGCGLITSVIRCFSGAYPEGVSYSILIMNLAVPLIDRYTRPKIFGYVKKKKEASA
jgi:electron transport complex protein RnfD